MSDSIKKIYNIVIEEACWRVEGFEGDSCFTELLNFDADIELAAKVEQLSELLTSLGYAGTDVCLALASSQCLCSHISIAELPRKNRRRVMSFRLEEHLPISAESVVADYVEIDRQEALGVCSELGRLTPLVDALEAAGVSISHICPTAFMKASWLVAHEKSHDFDAVVIETSNCDADSAGGSYDLIELCDGRPISWLWFSGDAACLGEHVNTWLVSRGGAGKILLAGGGDSLQLLASAGNELLVEKLSEDKLAIAVASSAAELLAGSQSAWINLRRDSLAAATAAEKYARPAAFVIAAAVLMFAVIIGATQLRGRSYDSLRRENITACKDVFKDVLPRQRAVGGYIRRLDSEAQRLRGLAGKSVSQSGQPQAVERSALLSLRDFLAALPGNIRYKIVELRIEAQRVSVSGQARSHLDAEAISVALRNSGKFKVDPPKTQALKDRGVNFSFAASPLLSADAKGAGK